MSLSSSRPSFHSLLRTFAQDSSLGFAGGLTTQQIEDACKKYAVKFGRDIWTVPLTLWTFITQCATACSCVAAVQHAAHLLISLGQEPCSGYTGAYCKQRVKLAAGFLEDLTLQIGRQMEDQALTDWRWHGHPVVYGDGTTLTTPDTPENQEAFPQSRRQKTDLGFPAVRLVVIMAFATGACLGAAMGPCEGKQTGELALFRRIIDRIQPGSIFVADRAYDAYWLIVWLQARNVQVAVRMQSRKRSRKIGRRLGPNDYLVTWHRPPCPDWMDPDDYEQLPLTIQVREVQVTVRERGCRVRSLTVATSLTDESQYPADQIAELYQQRWRIEIKIRDVKSAMKMDILTCRTPDMVIREIWGKLMAYNLIRQVMAQAALAESVSPRSISFAAARSGLDTFRSYLTEASNDRPERIGQFLEVIGCHRVGNRPGRVEPRKVKRRPKSYPLLTQSRAAERAKLLEAGAID